MPSMLEALLLSITHTCCVHVKPSVDGVSVQVLAAGVGGEGVESKGCTPLNTGLTKGVESSEGGGGGGGGGGEAPGMRG